MDRDILRPRWPYFQFQKFGLSEEIPRVVSHSPELAMDYLCVDMLLLD